MQDKAAAKQHAKGNRYLLDGERQQIHGEPGLLCGGLILSSEAEGERYGSRAPGDMVSGEMDF